jgi:hypothetical protein
MKRIFRPALAAFLASCLIALTSSTARADAGKYRNFRVAIYVVVNATQKLSDPNEFAREYDRVARQLKFDKVYVEVYRNHQFASDAQIEAVKKLFRDKGVAIAGGVTLAAGGQGGQFGTFDYESAADRAECEQAVRLAARHFDEVIMDDFFFYTSKSDADIAAKGSRSWTQYRLDTMRDVSQKLVLGPAKSVNPKIRVIIKYPNWYEHFQGLGYDLEKESHMFDGIYTGTETRDPVITDQLLQQYESYDIIRYFDNIRPGGNGGGWVDTFSTRYVDRYPEQLWDTLFAKAPEITLFSWAAMADPRAVDPGERAAWKSKPTSFDWDAMVKSYRPAGKADPGPGWASVAGRSLEHVDKVLGFLGNPKGIPSYKPYQSTGEDFLQNYLGNIGVPIEMTPDFPSSAKTILLTEQAKHDPEIIARIKTQLSSGGNVVITSGFLRAMQDKGLEDIVEWQDTGRVVAVHDFINGFGAGSGASLNDPAHDNPAILFPEIHFYTNDSWPIVRGAAGAKGFPIMLMNRYSKGVIYLLTIPENMGDLYNLPRGLLSQIRDYVVQDFPVRIDSPPQVSLFAYDNNTFVIQSFRADDAAVTIHLADEHKSVRDAVSGKTLDMAIPQSAAQCRGRPQGASAAVTILPHSYRVFRIGDETH